MPGLVPGHFAKHVPPSTVCALSQCLTSLQRFVRCMIAASMRSRLSIAVAAVAAPLSLFACFTANAAAPDDLVVQQRSLRGIRAIEAWGITTCSSATIVAVIDSGVDRLHPDLVHNLWYSSQEIAGNGIDEDGNGYVDDAYGWDFVGNDGDVRDLLGRGTHLAGIIGAEGGNGLGVTGLCHDVTLLPIRVHGREGEVTDIELSPATGATAIRYATSKGVHVILASFTTSKNDADLRAAVREAIAAGAVVVVPAGDGAQNLDGDPLYPAAWDEPGLISVASVDEGAKLALSSNRGKNSVSMVAPGVNVFSTLPGALCGVMGGTPQAAAHVAGGVAMLRSLRPELTPDEVAEKVITLSSHREILDDTVKSASILDLGLLIAEKRDSIEARIVAPRKVKVGEDVIFDGRESEGAIVEFLWKFGDPHDQFGPVVPHRWDRPGSVGVELLVRTHDGRSASQRITVKIEGNDALTSCGCALSSDRPSLGGLLPLALIAIAALLRRKALSAG